ncbi:MAG TPA: TlpA disulfide reductase family protein [Bacteroidota bacterium]|nr:TlpA disulfide reductase family protein [Bacteroidota bacterium]
MGRFGRAVMACAAAVLVFAAAAAQDEAVAPDFKLPNGSGGTVQLSKLRGKVVAVNFWATWCGPCRAEIPGMLDVYEKYKAKGLEIVGISVDRDGWGVINPFVKKLKITYPVVLGTGETTDAYGGIDAIPTTFFVDRKGHVLKRHVGYMSKEEFEETIKNFL